MWVPFSCGESVRLLLLLTIIYVVGGVATMVIIY